MKTRHIASLLFSFAMFATACAQGSDDGNSVSSITESDLCTHTGGRWVTLGIADRVDGGASSGSCICPSGETFDTTHGCVSSSPTPPPPSPAPCTDSECGPEPYGLPNHICPDGSTAGPVCERNSSGTCGWVIASCPDSGTISADASTVPPTADAGSPTPVPATDAGPTPVPASDGGALPPGPSPVPASDGGVSPPTSVCTASSCGPEPYGLPNYICADGSTAGPVCELTSTGTCGWVIRSCP